jgi:hypothetical protein
MTLLEVLLVLGLMGLLLVIGTWTLRGVAKTALRSDTVEVAAALKAARNLAAQSGMHHRVVFNLDQHTYQIEACPDPIQLRKTEEEERPDPEALARLAEQPNPLGAPGTGMGMAGAMMGALGGGVPNLGTGSDEVSQAESPEQALKASAALAGVRVGTARCGVAPASGGDRGNYADPARPNVHKLASDSGIVIRRVHVKHLRDPIERGEVSVHFFPLGMAEKAVLELVDRDGDQFTVLVHGLTGRIEVRGGEVDPDRHMRRDAAGDEVDEP